MNAAPNPTAHHDPAPYDSSPEAPIVVGVGDPEREEALLRYAVSLAVAERRDLRLVHAIHPIVAAGGPGAMVVDYDIARRTGEEIIRRAVGQTLALLDREAGPDRDCTVRVHWMTQLGNTVDVLSGASTDACRLVVMRRRRPRLQQLATGSVSRGVAGRSRTPVIVVPEGWSRDGDGDRRFRLVVGLRGDVYDDGLVEEGFAQADRYDARLTFLHAWYLPSMYDDLIVDRTSRDDWSEREAVRIRTALEPWTRRHPHVPNEVEVVHMPAGDALIRAAAKADLLLLGRHGPGRHFPHVGSVSRAALREASCPVEIVPAGHAAADSPPVPHRHTAAAP